jgi:hypothetical protein
MWKTFNSVSAGYGRCGAPSLAKTLILLLAALLAAPCAAGQSLSSPASTTATEAAPSAAAQSHTASADAGAAKARQLLDQMIAALGGQAWLTYKTLSQQGRSYSFYHGKPNAEGTLFWRFYEYPDKERRELTKQRDVVYIYNGGKGYEKTYKGTTTDEQKAVDEEVRRSRHSLEVVIREWLKDPGTLLFYDGQSVADQQLVDVVSLLNKDNDQVSIGIEVHSHLPINKRYNWRDPDKYKVEDETIYGNYRKVQGIQTPYTITTTRDGEMTGQVFLSRAEYNAAFAAGFFDATITYNRESYRPAKK